MKAKHIMLVLGMTMILTFTGCGSSKPVVEVTPTPAATPTPTEVPVTVTPVPTSTPAPKVIGVKTSQAKYIYMTNKLEDDIREIYLMTSGGDDWGKNLIPAEASVKASEQVQMFYTPDDTAVSSDSTDESTDTTTITVYDMKIVTAKGDVYQIYSIDLGDMEKASLAYDEESSTAYLTYTSLADKSEKDTKGNSQQTASSDESDDSDTETYSSDDSSDDSSYDSGSSDSSSYDNSSDDSSDDSSYDSSSSDNSGYDDGSSYDDRLWSKGRYSIPDHTGESDSRCIHDQWYAG